MATGEKTAVTAEYPVKKRTYLSRKVGLERR